jgi:hypothetical protein
LQLLDPNALVKILYGLAPLAEAPGRKIMVVDAVDNILTVADEVLDVEGEGGQPLVVRVFERAALLARLADAM